MLVLLVKKIKDLLVLILVSILFLSCTKSYNGYLIENLDELKGEQVELISLLETKPLNNETQFALINGITTNLFTKNQTTHLILFLSNVVENQSDNPYNAYWLLMIAHSYLEKGASEIARYYFERIINNYPDLEIKGTSIHLSCLQNLIKITDSPELQIEYYTQLITKFSDYIFLPETYFLLAQTYERLGEWDLAIQSYNHFLSYKQVNIVISGVPAAYDYAKAIVDYSSSTKDWTFETLDDLVKAVKSAIDRYDHRSLDKYRAKVNFFAMSWKQEINDNYPQADFVMRDFMVGNRIRYQDMLDPSSSSTEAYLRTSGWNQYMTVWFLYFRKVNFPADPEIHGRWEWAGIYYGEKI